MTDEEILILNFLQPAPGTFFARREIARRAVRRQVFEENPHWPDAALAVLVNKGALEQNEAGLYRIKPDAVLKKP